MQRLYLIRHAKSSWADERLADFHRPLKTRGVRAAEAMGARLAAAGIVPQLIVSSPAVRARSTAAIIADGVGCAVEGIVYDEGLYLGSEEYHYELLGTLFGGVDEIFLVGHNDTISFVAAHLCGRDLGNVPTCGIVAIEYGAGGFSAQKGAGRLVFFWYPKDQGGG